MVVCECGTTQDRCSPARAMRIQGALNVDGIHLDIPQSDEVEAFLFLSQLVQKWQAMFFTAQPAHVINVSTNTYLVLHI